MAIKNSKTNNTTTEAFKTLYNASSGQREKSTNTPYGVSDSAWEGTKETFSPSDKTNDAKTNMDSASNRYQEHTESDMISSSTKNAMNESFKKPSIVTETDEWLLNQLETIKSGRTSYSDQVEAMMDKILNREKFSYDVDNDTLFQQALASAMKSGKTAMQDTIGQASALTGGYGSTYATSVGNQAYSAYIEDAYDNLPQYYQMALEAYQMEGEDMYRQYGMLSDADDKEFNRNVAAYDATFRYRNNVYNEAYTQYRDNKSDAFATANLEMQEYSQKSNDLYSLYGIASNTYESMYEKDYTSWADKVNNAWKTVEVENSDAWANKNFDEGVRQYEQTFAEQQRQYNESLAEQKRQHNEQMAYNYASLNQKKSGGGGNGFNFDFNGDGVTDSLDVLKAMDSKGVKSFQASIMNETEFRRRRNAQNERYDTYDQYIMAKLEEWSNKKSLTEYETEFLLGYYFSN